MGILRQHEAETCSRTETICDAAFVRQAVGAKLSSFSVLFGAISFSELRFESTHVTCFNILAVWKARYFILARMEKCWAAISVVTESTFYDKEACWGSASSYQLTVGLALRSPIKGLFCLTWLAQPLPLPECHLSSFAVLTNTSKLLLKCTPAAIFKTALMDTRYYPVSYREVLYGATGST